jgi:hypothetical protein
MPLNGYSSLCEERQRIIVSRDSGTRREHRAFNNDPCHVTKYKIDGDIVRDTSIRCDFLVMNDDRRDAYLIELKGSDIEHALDQLEATAHRFQNELRGYCIKYRLVCSRVKTQAIRSIKYKKFCKKHNSANEFICQENQIKEPI